MRVIAVCEEKNSPKAYRYHPALFVSKKWSCCKSGKRSVFGCQAATHWSSSSSSPSSEANNNPSRKYQIPVRLAWGYVIMLTGERVSVSGWWKILAGEFGLCELLEGKCKGLALLLLLSLSSYHYCRRRCRCRRRHCLGLALATRTQCTTRR